MGDFDIAADMKRDFPVPVGQIQKPVKNDAGAVMLSRLPRLMTEGAINVVVASFGVPFVLGLASVFCLADLSDILTSLLYFTNLSTAFTELTIFQPVLFLPDDPEGSSGNSS